MREWITELQEIIDELGIYARSATLAVSSMLTKLYPFAELSLQEDKPNIFLQHGQAAVAIGVEFASVITPRILRELLASLTIGEGLVASRNVNKFVLVAVGANSSIAAGLLDLTSQIIPTDSSEIWIGYLDNEAFIPVTNRHLAHILFS